MIRQLRWSIVYWVDKLVPRQCWARLVPWALYGPNEERRFPFASAASCQLDSRGEQGCCDCGKYMADWRRAEQGGEQ